MGTKSFHLRINQGLFDKAQRISDITGISINKLFTDAIFEKYSKANISRQRITELQKEIDQEKALLEQLEYEKYKFLKTVDQSKTKFITQSRNAWASGMTATKDIYEAFCENLGECDYTVFMQLMEEEE